MTLKETKPNYQLWVAFTLLMITIMTLYASNQERIAKAEIRITSIESKACEIEKTIDDHKSNQDYILRSMVMESKSDYNRLIDKIDELKGIIMNQDGKKPKLSRREPIRLTDSNTGIQLFTAKNNIK